MKHPKAAARHVAVTNAPAGIPVLESMLGFTAIIYAIVRNVVRPANISFFILTFSLFIIDKKCPFSCDIFIINTSIKK